MKVYRIIVIAISLILGISFSAVIYFSPARQSAINEPVTEEYYEMLKENALNIARTLDKSVLNDETLTGNFYFSPDELVVTVESMKAKLTAKIPILQNTLNIEDSTIKYQGNVEFKNVKYEKESRLMPAWYYMVLAIFGGMFIALMVYLLLFEAWRPSKKYQ